MKNKIHTVNAKTIQEFSKQLIEILEEELKDEDLLYIATVLKSRAKQRALNSIK